VKDRERHSRVARRCQWTEVIRLFSLHNSITGVYQSYQCIMVFITITAAVWKCTLCHATILVRECNDLGIDSDSVLISVDQIGNDLMKDWSPILL